MKSSASEPGLRCHDGDDNEDVKKAIGWIVETTTLHVHHAFLYTSLPSLQDYDGKMPNFTFYDGRKQATAKFSLSFWTWIWFLVIRLKRGSPGFACIWQSKWFGVIAIEIERTQIHFSSDVFVAVAVVIKIPYFNWKWTFSFFSSIFAKIFGQIVSTIRKRL